jgi:hypothetical protein
MPAAWTTPQLHTSSTPAWMVLAPHFLSPAPAISTPTLHHRSIVVMDEIPEVAVVEDGEMWDIS